MGPRRGQWTPQTHGPPECADPSAPGVLSLPGGANTSVQVQNTPLPQRRACPRARAQPLETTNPPRDSRDFPVLHDSYTWGHTRCGPAVSLWSPSIMCSRSSQGVPSRCHTVLIHGQVIFPMRQAFFVFMYLSVDGHMARWDEPLSERERKNAKPPLPPPRSPGPPLTGRTHERLHEEKGTVSGVGPQGGVW